MCDGGVWYFVKDLKIFDDDLPKNILLKEVNNPTANISNDIDGDNVIDAMKTEKT